MKRSILALPLAVAPGFAAADVTPEDVWAIMQATSDAVGMTTTSTVARDGDTLTITDGLVTLRYPVIGGQATLTLPQIDLTAQGDGSVSIVTPETYVMTLTADVPETAEPLVLDIAVAQNGVSTVATGDPGDVTYTTEIADIDVIVAMTAGPDLPEGALDISMEMDGGAYSSVSRMTQGDLLTLSADVTNRDTTTRMTLTTGAIVQSSTSQSPEMRTQMNLSLPSDVNIMNLTSALENGLALTIAGQSSGSSGTTITTMDGAPFSEQSQSAGPGTVSLGLSKAGLVADGAFSGFEAAISQPDILPFPINFSASAVSGSFGLPVVASDTPQDATYAISLEGLEIAESIWGMIDPAGGLDRSPLTLTVDLAAKLDWGLDLFDLAGLAALEQTGEFPVAPVAATIETFSIAALGGTVDVTGAFTFDNTDLATFPGMPRPEGKASAKASGLNGVIDQLIATGLLPEDQAGMGRMFMGMFARATGDDSLESDVEVNAEGHVILNGQRMR